MNYKKLRKLLRSPKLFFKDMAAKRILKLGLLPDALNFSKQAETIKGHFQYTVVSAVYNVEKYLDYFFRTLTRQTLGFKDHIHLIMVDDGSGDSSREIIEKWRLKFPENITYIYKENGGQASARNVGLEYVETDYVTFIDPDDFIDQDYFQIIDNFLFKNREKEVRMVGCNILFYREMKGVVQDNHPLRYRFSKDNVLVNMASLGKYMQLSAATAFFEADVIHRNALRFDENIRPNFEDAHFVGRFLALAGGGHVAFLKGAKYYYRKRSDGTSTLDNSGLHTGSFDEVLRLGCLDLIRIYRDSAGGVVPEHIQRTVLYDTFWRIKGLINHPERVGWLTSEQRENFVNFLNEIYNAIDSKTILEFDLAGAWFYHKIGLLHCFKGEPPPFQIVYVEAYDSNKRQVQLVYYTGEPVLEEFMIDGEDVLPVYSKVARHDFLGKTFTEMRIVWLPISNEASKLSVRLNGIQARLTLGGKQYREGLAIDQIVRNFVKPNSAILADSSTWLLMDRDTQADDNAEHFYRYMRLRHPEQSIRFVLRKGSHDWRRLEKEGFDLIAYGSREHEIALHGCEKIISSHIDQYVVDYFRDGSLKNKSIIFLQHGVIKDDLSDWLNKKKIDCFVTSSPLEFESIANDGNRYKFTSKEVVLTGLARHDELLRRRDSWSPEKIILVMPTWRKILSGKMIEGNLRARNSEFMKSQYAQAWQFFLSSEDLKIIAAEYQYKIIFFPHANVQPYLDEFDLPPYITVVKHNEGSIQDLFSRAALLVTDFSSVAFDMAFLEKAILYYQFDRKEFFSGSHTFQSGYFDYEKDGFGPVCLDQATLINELEKLLAQNARPAPEYLERMTRFFPFRDGKNCERIYQAIQNLDEPQCLNERIRNTLYQHALMAEKSENWLLAEKRWRHYLSVSDSPQDRKEAQQHLIQAMFNRDAAFLKDIEARPFAES